MMKSFPKSLSEKLAQREETNSLRKLPVSNTLIDFSSNDYLGLSKSSQIFEQAHHYLVDNKIIRNGATGSRLISGNHQLYNKTENYISAFHQAESTIIFNSGYDANVGLFSSIPQKGDIILYDEYIHASIRDGIRLSNAKAYKFSHNDVGNLEKLLKKVQSENIGNNIYVVTESVFSMDGDSPDLGKIVSLSEQYNAFLIVDEAHALGVMGEKGEGLILNKIFARIVTFGKGLGCHGAAILGSSQLKDYLVNFARSFIYTTGLPPHSLATILTAYKHLENSRTEREFLDNNIAFFTLEVNKLGLQNIFIKSTSAIHCAVIPGNERVKTISSVLRDNGFDVKAILSPTVPQEQERLRFCLHAYNTKQEITDVLQLLKITL